VKEDATNKQDHQIQVSRTKWVSLNG